MKQSNRILAIETSCDETGLAVLQKKGDAIEVISQVVASQVDIHAETGGVVPEVAAREHVKIFQPLLKKVLKEANIVSPGWRSGGPPTRAQQQRALGGGAGADRTRGEVDAIAITVGPGLIPALAVGVQAARTLAYAWHKPIIPVHHIEGHIYSALCAEKSQIPMTKSQTNTKFQIPGPKAFPILALIVSGGHTMLIEMREHLHYRVLGETRDDAAGEAFDKVARLLNLPYPGGPALSRLAERGNPRAFAFPRPMVHSNNFDFSFSGLKTAVYYTLRDNPTAKPEDIAASFQQAVVDTLVTKTAQAAQAVRPQAVLLAGGVAANTRLRQELTATLAQQRIELRAAPLALCGDNAVMIGQTGLLALEHMRTISWQQLEAHARIDLTPWAERWG